MQPSPTTQRPAGTTEQPIAIQHTIFPPNHGGFYGIIAVMLNDIDDIKATITNLAGGQVPQRPTRVPTRPVHTPVPQRAAGATPERPQSPQGESKGEPQAPSTPPEQPSPRPRPAGKPRRPGPSSAPKHSAALPPAAQPVAPQSQQGASTPPERLNKYLAFHLGVSRRQADDIITKKPITINGQPAQIGARVQPGDTVAINGQPIGPRKRPTYLYMHKPTGYVCSRKRQGDTPTIFALLPRKYHNLKPVGRLDANSSGLLLLTDDGDFAFRHTHPKFHKTKQYVVTLNMALQPLHQQMIADYGVALEDGPSRLGLTRLGDSRVRWNVTMAEGRNRQIRRTFATLGYTVIGLHRTSFGRYSLGRLKPGQFTVSHTP